MNKEALSEDTRTQYQEAVDNAAAAHRRKDWQAALPLWRKARALIDTLPGPRLGEGQALENLGRKEDARAVFEDAALRWPDHFGFSAGLARANEALGFQGRARLLWESVAGKWPDRHEGHLGIVRTALNQDDDRHIFDLAKAAMYRWPDVREAVHLASEAAQNALNASEILNFWQEASESFPSNLAVSIAYTEALYFFESPEEAIGIALNCLHGASAGSDPALCRQLALRTSAWLTRTGRVDDALSAVDVGLNHLPSDEQLLLTKGEILAAQDLQDDAEAAFREVIRLSPDNLHAYLGLAAIAASRANPFAAAEFAEAGAGSRVSELVSSKIDLKRPVVRGETSEIQESPPGTSGTLVVILGGAYRKSLGMPIELMDRYFAARNISALYVRDGAIRTITGVSGGSSPSQALEERVREAQKKLGEKRLYIVGVSAGGFEAIRLGLRCTPDGVIGISAPTNLTQSFLDTVEDKRARLLVKRFNRLYSDYELDMALPLRQHPNPPPIHLIFPVENYGDRTQAEYLGAWPNVTLHPITGWKGHNVHEKLIATGELFGFFDKLISD